MKLRIALRIAVCLFATGCAGYYSDAPKSSPFATFVFKKAYTTGTTFKSGPGAPFGGGTFQHYAMVDSAACGVFQSAATFMYLDGNTKSRRVPAGALAHVVALTEYTNTQGVVPGGPGITVQVTDTRCAALAEFTPVAGHTYEVALEETSGRGCYLRVTDTAAAAAPADLSIRDRFRCPDWTPG